MAKLLLELDQLGSEKVLVNPNHIVCIQRTNDNIGPLKSVITLVTGKQVSVKQSMKDIQKTLTGE